jgi:hypothetical protein
MAILGANQRSNCQPPADNQRELSFTQQPSAGCREFAPQTALRRNRTRERRYRFLFRKNAICASLSRCPSTDFHVLRRSGLIGRAPPALPAAAAAKNLEQSQTGFADLQPVEIPRNRQGIVWKNLEGTSGVLERLGLKACRLAGASAPSERAIGDRFARGSR